MIYSMNEYTDREANIVCPKCGSSDVLVGSNDIPNKCSKCNKKWKEGEETARETLSTGGIPDTMGAIPRRSAVPRESIYVDHNGQIFGESGEPLGQIDIDKKFNEEQDILDEAATFLMELGIPFQMNDLVYHPGDLEENIRIVTPETITFNQVPFPRKLEMILGMKEENK